MAQLFTNNAVTTLASGINSSATTIAVASGKGALFPSPTNGDYALLTLTQAGSAETSWEIVYLDSRSGDVLTVQRAQEGTVAASWSAGAKVELRITAEGLMYGVLGPYAVGQMANDVDNLQANYTNLYNSILRLTPSYRPINTTPYTLTYGANNDGIGGDQNRLLRISVDNCVITIPTQATAGFPEGATITIYNGSPSWVDATIVGATSLVRCRVSGASTAGTRTLAPGAIAELRYIGVDGSGYQTWIVSGAGVS